MAKETALEMWLGSDHQFVYQILDLAEAVALDVSGWTLSWMVKQDLEDADADAKLTLSATGDLDIAGTFDADPDVSAQRVTVTVSKADVASLDPGQYYAELKRMDVDYEGPVAHGIITFRRGVQRA